MPRFYFERVWSLRTLDRAEREATLAAVGRDRFPRGHAREVTVEVRNEQNQQVMTVRVAMQVDRVGFL